MLNSSKEVEYLANADFDWVNSSKIVEGRNKDEDDRDVAAIL